MRICLVGHTRIRNGAGFCAHQQDEAKAQTAKRDGDEAAHNAQLEARRQKFMEQWNSVEQRGWGRKKREERRSQSE